MQKRVLIFAIGAVVSASIFAVDILFPLEFAKFDGEFSYVLVVLLARWSSKRSDVWLFAGLAGIPTILGYFLSLGDVSPWAGMPALILALITIGMVSGLIFRGKGLSAKFKQSAEMFRLLVEQSPEGVVVHEADKIVFANQAAIRLFGASTLDEFIKIHPIDLIRDEDKPEVLERRRQVLEDGRVFSAIQTIIRKLDGSEFFAERYAARVLWNGRPAIHFIVRDITHRTQTEMALREAKESAERANASKSRFLAAASHDLRQPIQALNLFVHSLGRKAKGNEEIEELVGNIRLSSEVMSGLLNALLDISKLDAGMVDPEIEDFPIETVLDDVSNTFLEHARAKGLELRVVSSGAVVKSDPTLVRRIIYNYVSNAVRYTDSGRVLLGCRKVGDMLHIEVWDTGPGIPESEQTQIFEEFYQLENPARDRSRGLGLGLAIIKRTAVLLGLEIGLRSVPGKGSMFWFATPISPEHAIAVAEFVPPQSSTVNSGKIILIEDDAIVLRGLEEVLLGAGYDVVATESAEEALTHLRGAVVPPDLIIADHRLGFEVTGIDAIGVLQDEFGDDVPAIIITGDTAPDRLREASEGGHVLLHKPVAPELLLKIVAQEMHRQETPVLSG
ncbi:MAG: PAS domain S-box protein [Rhodospirillales bacterium]|nr:PAS domain S-box protein [Rhodospirillales bacterium]